MQITRPMHLVSGCQTRSLATLIDLYERNYLRLTRLVPNLGELGDHVISRRAGMLDLHLSVIQRHKFTTELLLTYRFTADAGVILEPNVLVRVYHDAHCAEAMSHNRRPRVRDRRIRCQRRAVPSDLEIKWELNAFLNRWLGYCLRQGHGFTGEGAAGAQAAAGGLSGA